MQGGLIFHRSLRSDKIFKPEGQQLLDSFLDLSFAIQYSHNIQVIFKFYLSLIRCFVDEHKFLFWTLISMKTIYFKLWLLEEKKEQENFKQFVQPLLEWKKL